MNNAIRFNGTTGYIEVPLAPPTANGGALTIEFWNYNDAGGSGVDLMFVPETLPATQRILCHAPWGGRLYWDAGSPAGPGRLDVDYAPYQGKWTHVALVYSPTVPGKPGTQALYLNGKDVAHKASDTITTRFTKLMLGAGHLATPQGGTTIDSPSRSTMDALRIWSVARSAEDVLRTMNEEVIGDEPDLYAAFEFNGGIVDRHAAIVGSDDEWKTLRNRVKGSPDGTLVGLQRSDYVSSKALATAPVGPVFSLVKDNIQYLTSSHTEKAQRVKDGWKLDAEPAFHAKRAPAPGTIPLFCLRNTKTGELHYTASRTERMKLDPRQHVSQLPGEWAYDNETVYVAERQTGTSIPLYRYVDVKTKRHRYSTNEKLGTGFGGRELVAYVLGSLTGKYEPSPMSFTPSGLSEDLWYVLTNRSFRDGYGLSVDASKTRLLVREIPLDTDYTSCQWRVKGNRLINRWAPELSITMIDGTIQLVPTKDADPGQEWTFEPVVDHGTDCFALRQAQYHVAVSSFGKVVARTRDVGDPGSWTFLAMGLQEGKTIPGPTAEHSGIPYSRYLPIVERRNGKDTTIHVLGTGTVSDWAMLRVHLIVSNVVRALRPEMDVEALDGVEVVVISQDDSPAELDETPCVGFLYDEAAIKSVRGGASAVMCYVTEEMMWTSAVYHSPRFETFPRNFDQVVHEFGHVIHWRLAKVDENQAPVGPTPAGLDPRDVAEIDGAKGAQRGMTQQKQQEIYAMSVQTWFDSLTQVAAQYAPRTRAELRAFDPDRFAYLAGHFDQQNLWKPPMEPRRRRPFISDWNIVDGDYKIRYEAATGSLKVVRSADGTVLLNTADKLTKGKTVVSIEFASSGELVFRGPRGDIVAGVTALDGRWPYRLKVEMDDAGAPKLVVRDADNVTVSTLIQG